MKKTLIQLIVGKLYKFNYRHSFLTDYKRYFSDDCLFDGANLITIKLKTSDALILFLGYEPKFITENSTYIVLKVLIDNQIGYYCVPVSLQYLEEFEELTL
jgi:hypothetical protein